MMSDCHIESFRGLQAVNPPALIYNSSATGLFYSDRSYGEDSPDGLRLKRLYDHWYCDGNARMHASTERFMAVAETVRSVE